MDLLTKDFAMTIVLYKNDEKLTEVSANVNISLNRQLKDVIATFLPEEYNNFYVDALFCGKDAHLKKVPTEMPIRTAINFWYDCTFITCQLKEKEVVETAKSELEQIIGKITLNDSDDKN